MSNHFRLRLETTLLTAHMVVDRGRVIEAVERVNADGVVCSDLERRRTIAVCTRSMVALYEERIVQRVEMKSPLTAKFRSCRQ